MRYKIKKGLLKPAVEYDCPECNSQLASDLKKAGTDDSCPQCGHWYTVPGTDALKEYERTQEEKRQEKEEKKKQRDIERREAKADKRHQQEMALKAKEIEHEQEMALQAKEIEQQQSQPQSQPNQATANSDHSSSDQARDQAREKTLYEANPAMFRNNPLGFVISIILIIAFGLGLVILLVWWLKCKNEKLTVTNKRTILRTGILSKNTNEVMHRDIRNIQVSQSLFQRMFNTGTIEISSAGQSGVELTASGYAAPQKVHKTIDACREG